MVAQRNSGCRPGFSIRVKGSIRCRLRCAAIAVVCAPALALPATATATSLKGVTITRDPYGEAHIRAASAQKAAFGLAYAQMQDQATWVLSALATATGRSAEVLGPGCLPGCFRQDQLTHLFRVPESADQGFDSLPADSRKRLTAFADGINAYISDHPEQVPSWAQPVGATDVLAGVEFPFVLSQASEAIGGATLTEDSDRRSFAAIAAEAGDRFDLGASNGFALAGSRTESGSPILEGNPHLPFEGAFQWYAARLVYPGTRVAGATFRGTPGIALGTNGDVAWTHTANHTTQNEVDVYRETLQSGIPNAYRFGSSFEPMEVRSVPIVLQTPNGPRTVTVTMRYTTHGPVISDPPANVNGNQPAPATDEALAATVSQYRQVGLATQLWAENEADSLAEFKRALSQDQLSGFNVIAADAKHIYFAAGSRSGILAPGLSGAGVLDGSDPSTAWQGILPFEQLPQASDPPNGYLQNANNSAAYSAPGQIDPQALPLYLQADVNGTRSRRQVQLLEALDDAVLGDAQRIGLDDFVEFAPGLEGLLDQAAPGADPRVEAGAALIGSWDERAAIGSTQYPLFATWVRGLRENVLGFSVANPPAPGTQFSAAQRNEASRAMIAAVDGMTAAYGRIDVGYGGLHTLTRGPLAAPVGGGDADLPTLRLTNCKGEAGSTSPDYYHPCHVRGGSGFVFNVDLATRRLTVMRPVADTDDPASPTYTANARDYVHDRYRVWPLEDAKLQLRSTRVEVAHGGAISLPLRCRPHGNGGCRGKLKLAAASGGEKQAAGAGARSFSLPAGRRRLRLLLPSEVADRVVRRGVVDAVLRLTVNQFSGERLRHSIRLSLVGQPGSRARP